MSTVTAPVPRVSVVVRSYNRLTILPQLLVALLAQDHDSFEIVVVEQSTKRPPEAVVRVDELARDPRVRVVRAEPLGGPRARNVGVRATRGEIVVLIDDDDLPSGPDWLRNHEANYGDPKCLGVSGRHLGENDPASEKPYANMDKARRCVLSFNVLKFQRCYVCTDRRKQVESLHGTNASIRRSALERFGLWDECTPILRPEESRVLRGGGDDHLHRRHSGRQPDSSHSQGVEINLGDNVLAVLSPRSMQTGKRQVRLVSGQLTALQPW